MIILNEQLYEKITSPIRNKHNGEKILKQINKFSTLTVYFTYPLFLFLLAYKRDIRFWKLVIIPGVSFVLVSLFRGHINFARPYEVLDIDPIIKKDTRGKSFPSRHVFSVFIIAMTLYYISIPVSISLMAIGVIVAIVRVVGGVHFPRDVVAGAVTGVLCAIIGWNLINL